MFKRIISAILCIAICCGCIIYPVSAKEQNIGIYTEKEIDEILFNFRNYDSEMNVLFGSDTSVVYWNLSNQISENDVLKWLLETASGLIDEKPDKEDYARILTNILVMKQGNLADQIENQSQFDNLKGLDDYAWDVAEIVVSFVDINKIAELVSPALKTGLDGKELIVSNVENAKYYEMVLKDYAYAESFLNAIYKNAKDEQLRKVAKSLLRGNEELLRKRLEYLSDNLEATVVFEWKFFKENLGFSLLKHTDLYGTDEAFKYFVDYGGDFLEWFDSVPKLAFKATILAGDLWFGTSDTYNRYQEMKIMSDIAQALVTDINGINLDTTVTDETLSKINQKCYLYQMLILSHIRGEYLVYKLLTEEAGFASWLKRLIDSYKDSEETVEGRYNSQIEILEKYYNLLCNLYPQVNPDEAEEEKHGINSQKKLQQVNVTYSDGSKGQTVFKYNSSGLVTSSVFTSTYSEGSQETVYSYDEGNRLMSVQINSEDWYAIGPKAEYIYDNNGFLIKSSEAEGSRVIWLYENDVNGRCVRSSSEAEGTSYQSVYSYNDDSTQKDEIRAQTDSAGNITTDYISYFYDETGRIIREVYNGAHYSHTIEYSYDYKPFVFAFKSGTNAYNVYLPDIMGNPVWEIEYIEIEKTEQDNDGYLTQLISDSGVIYEFVYETQKETHPDRATTEKQYGLEGQTQNMDNISFSDIPSEFVFSSGAGGWGTYLTIEADGSFKGEYHDSDMGITGEGYPRGTVYICNFDGKFTEPQKVSEYTYSMKLESLNVKETAGKEYIENEILYITSEPYGMENADEFYIYLPGASMAELPESFLSWTHIDRDIRDTLPSGYYGIYNAGGEKGFTATEDDFIWNRDYMYYYQNRKAAMWPRYYGKSHVLFWPESGASVIDLQFAWKNDNQTEFDAYDANGSGEYHIKFDISDDMSTVNVSATSVNGVDLSSWGGTSDGHFTATFADDQSIQ